MNENLTAEMVGLPTELFNDLKNVVATTQRVGTYLVRKVLKRVTPAEQKALNDKYKADLRAAALAGRPRSSVPVPSFYYFTHEFTPTTKDSPFGMYVLNFLHDRIHTFGYVYNGVINGKHNLTLERENWLDADGNVYPNFTSTLEIWKDGSQWKIQDTNSIPVQYYDVNGIWTPFTKQQIADMMKVNLSVVEAQEADYWICEERNPSTHITSVFPVFESATDFTTYISGKRADLVTVGNMIANTGMKTLKDYDIEMIAYNDCPVPAQQASDAASMGDGGECKAQWFETEAEAKSFKYDFDLNKSHAVLGFCIEVSAANGTPNGHYERFHAYFDLKNNRVMQSPSDK